MTVTAAIRILPERRNQENPAESGFGQLWAAVALLADVHLLERVSGYDLYPPPTQPAPPPLSSSLLQMIKSHLSLLTMKYCRRWKRASEKEGLKAENIPERQQT